MNSKVSLTYEDNQFNISIDDKIVLKESSLDISIERFKQILKDNTFNKAREAWDDIQKYMDTFENDMLKVNAEYKSLEFGSMKYFYVTDKTFYIKDGVMIELIGGYNLFKFIIDLVKDYNIENYEEILDLFKQSIEHRVMYRIGDSSISFTSAGFNYGSAAYNFFTKKISKGTSIEKGTFTEFKEYVLENLR